MNPTTPTARGNAAFHEENTPPPGNARWRPGAVVFLVAVLAAHAPEAQGQQAERPVPAAADAPAAAITSNAATVSTDMVRAAQLSRRLGFGSIAIRDAAERDVLAIGPAALPLVIAARRTASPEALFRLDGIQRDLERLAAEKAIEPAAVTLTAQDLPVREVLAALFAQAGSSIKLAPLVGEGVAGSQRISIAINRATFWEALDDVLDRAGLVLVCDDSPPGLLIAAAARAAQSPPLAVATGPLRVSVAGVEPAGPPPRAGAETESRTPSTPRGGGARVMLRVAWEPRLQPLLMRLSARSIVAEGPAGESMPPLQRAAVVEATIPSQRQWLDLPVLLSAPAVPLASLGMLRGTIVVWLTGMEHNFYFPNVRLDEAADASAGEAWREPLGVARAEVRLLSASLQDQRLLVRASITYDTPSEALASHHTWLAARPLEAAAADGLPLKRIDQRVTERNDRGITVTAAFALPPSEVGRSRMVVQPIQIRWKLPTAIHEVPVDFALRNIPLPAANGR